MWTMARCVAALENRLPDAVRVDVAFKKPVLLPGSVAFGSTPVDGGFAFSLTSPKNGAPHLAGVTRARSERDLPLGSPWRPGRPSTRPPGRPAHPAPRGDRSWAERRRTAWHVARAGIALGWLLFTAAVILTGERTAPLDSLVAAAADGDVEEVHLEGMPLTAGSGVEHMVVRWREGSCTTWPPSSRRALSRAGLRAMSSWTHPGRHPGCGRLPRGAAARSRPHP